MRQAFAMLLAGLMLLPAAAGAAEPLVPDRYGLALSYGYAYDPDDDIGFVLASGLALYDYDRVWPHRAPEPLRFKVELNAGATVRPRTRTMVSAAMLALYYLDRLATEGLRPYAEAGIGLVYTDFRVEGQGLRVNFNPQAGIGTEWRRTPGGATWFAALRGHHVSNGGLHRDNRGINSVLIQVGRFF